MVCLALVAFVVWSVPAMARVGCSAGAPLLRFQLAVEPPVEGGAPLPVREINRIEPGQKLVYAPIGRRGEDGGKGKITLVLVPSGPGDKLTVLPPKPAKAAAEWEAPFRTQVVALVYGPSGLDTKKVTTLVRKDQELIEQLADYAAKTAKTEKVLQALAAYDESPTATANLSAALSGFSTSYRGTPQLRWDAARDQQVAAVLGALNPALASYDPLAPESRQRMKQSAMLATSVAGLFFGSPVGLAAGGAAMAVNLSDMLFPDTDFRSAFVQDGGDYSMNLCAKRQKHRSRTRLAYLWAVRIPNVEAPEVEVLGPAHVPSGVASKVKVQRKGKGDWHSLERAKQWRLVPAEGGKEIPVRVRVVPAEESLQVDLTGRNDLEGVYRLAARWDWDEFQIAGNLYVHRLDGTAPRLREEAGDRLIAGAGAVTVELEGCDFQFAERVELRGPAVAGRPLPFALPQGRRAGTQKSLTVTLDTSELRPGDYVIALSFPDGEEPEVPIRLLPPHPALAGLPFRLNRSPRWQEVRLRGQGLERIEGASCERAEVEERGEGRLAVRLDEDVETDEKLDLLLQVEGVSKPVPVQDAIEVIGPAPRIVKAQVSLPGGLGVELRESELPASSFASFSLRVEPLESMPSLRLACAERELELKQYEVRAGEQEAGLRLRNAGANTLFLSLDPGTVGQAGCTLTARVVTAGQGTSETYSLGRVVRLPRIGQFELTAKPAPVSGYLGVLEGEDLELIERVGWDRGNGLPVNELPAALATGGQRQRLKVALPWPSPEPHAPLYIWLRGESRGRATTARY